MRPLSCLAPRRSLGECRESAPCGRERLLELRDEHARAGNLGFYRIDVGQSRAEGGTGLGLALVKHILNRHRGRLVIESVLGDGASFTVRLPLASAA